ncbi:MAG TPA: late competence development ComFB family protein [Spirochaetales bacterium]|nr:late competence development ComFB family protein [Spirochaetales bacterium]HRY54112.1 late competence development ComFB family protein [Spirochaetia bacterium]
MEIRNLMEDAVKAVVDELFELEAKDQRLGYCLCDQCRLDVACYVLNRIKPEYIVSSRGLAYSEKEGLDKVQRRADVISLVKEGWAKVTHAPRATADHGASGGKPESLDGPSFNFPTIMGRAFDGRTFAPIVEGSVRLLESGSEVGMVDKNWQNPFVLASGTAGTYIFWPKPVRAGRAGERRNWTFEIRVEAPGFDPASHFIELGCESESAARRDFSLQHVHKIPDLYLFPEGQGEEDE